MIRLFIERHIKKITATLLILVFMGAASFTTLFLSKPVCVSASNDVFMRSEMFLFDTADELEARRNERDQAAANAQAAANMVSSLAGQRNALSGELAELNQLSEEQMAQYEVIAAQLAAALIAKTEALDQYIQAQDNLAATEEMFQERLSVMFEYQNKSTLEVLLESNSIAGFFTNLEVISLIADSDAQAVDVLQVALDDAQLQADIKLQHADDMQAIADEKQKQLDELKKLIGQTEETLNNVESSIDNWEKKEDELEEEAKKLESKIKSLQTQYNKEHAATGGGGAGSTTYNSKGTKTVDGITWRWPTYTTSITSYYGYRIHPVYKTKKFHSGVDIGAGYGETIMAAASGTVILVSEPVEGKNKGGSGYGNYCIIDHGNGYSTLYGHARDIYVKNGQKVSRGKAIGEVGSTGTSTGAHLHFEVRINGGTTNPLNYLP